MVVATGHRHGRSDVAAHRQGRLFDLPAGIIKPLVATTLKTLTVPALALSGAPVFLASCPHPINSPDNVNKIIHIKLEINP